MKLRMCGVLRKHTGRLTITNIYSIRESIGGMENRLEGDVRAEI